MPEVRAKPAAKPKKRAAVVEKPRSNWWVYAAVVAAAAVIAFWAYGPALNGAFVFDDTVLPYHLPNFPEGLTAWVTGVRPMLMFSYWISYNLSKEPFGFHVFNVLVHVLNSVLVFLILARFAPAEAPARPARVPALLGALIFLFHPIQTESVSYIAGRSESL